MAQLFPDKRHWRRRIDEKKISARPFLPRRALREVTLEAQRPNSISLRRHGGHGDGFEIPDLKSSVVSVISVVNNPSAFLRQRDRRGRAFVVTAFHLYFS